MPARKRLRTRARTTARVRRRRGVRVTPRGRTAGRELSEVLNAQVESGEELRDTKLPVATEPAFVFKA